MGLASSRIPVRRVGTALWTAAIAELKSNDTHVRRARYRGGFQLWLSEVHSPIGNCAGCQVVWLRGTPWMISYYYGLTPYIILLGPFKTQ